MTKTKPRLKLAQIDGNAFAILGRAQEAARKAGWTKEQIDAFMQEAMSGSYDYLLQVCIENFDVD